MTVDCEFCRWPHAGKVVARCVAEGSAEAGVCTYHLPRAAAAGLLPQMLQRQRVVVRGFGEQRTLTPEFGLAMLREGFRLLED